jgi:toxin ParE1/3/4
VTGYSVIISQPAEDDLFAIYRYIAERAGDETALRFTDRIEQYRLSFVTFPERGTKRDDLRRGLRTIGFRRCATIVFEVDRRTRQVIIHGIHYAGRSLEGADDDDPADER